MLLDTVTQQQLSSVNCIIKALLWTRLIHQYWQKNRQKEYMQKTRKTSMPVIRTGIYPHMLIAITAHSLQHWPSPSKRRPASHTTHSPRLSSQVCHTRLTTVQCVIHFSIFDLGGLPLGQSSPKGEMIYYPPRSTIVQNFSPIMQTVYQICVTEVFLHFLA